jgi:hypothetical protein
MLKLEETVHGTSRYIMMDSMAEFCQRVPWGWVNLTWTVGGIVPGLTISFAEFFERDYVTKVSHG